MTWASNKFIQARTDAELHHKVEALQAKGWQLVEWLEDEHGCAAYLEWKKAGGANGKL